MYLTLRDAERRQILFVSKLMSGVAFIVASIQLTISVYDSLYGPIITTLVLGSDG